MTDELKGKTLGAILLESQILTPEQIEVALAEQRRTGKRLGEVLLDLGFVTAEDVRWGLSRQQSYSFVRVRPEAVDPEAVRAVPADLARRHMLVPFLLVGNELTVVMDDPTNRAAIEEIARITGRSVVVSIGLPDEIRAALDACYGPDDGSAHSEAVFVEMAPHVAKVRGLTLILGPRGPLTSKALAVLVRHCTRPKDRTFHLGPSGIGASSQGIPLCPPMGPTTTDSARLLAAIALAPDLVSIEDLFDPEVLHGALRAAAGGCRVLGVLPIASPEAAMGYLVEQSRSRVILADSLSPIVVVVFGSDTDQRPILVPVSKALRAAIRSRTPEAAGEIFGRAVRRLRQRGGRSRTEQIG